MKTNKKLEDCSKEELIKMIELLMNDGVNHKVELSKEKKLLKPPVADGKRA